MKKILGLLGAIGMTASGASNLMAMSPNSNENSNVKFLNLKESGSQSLSFTFSGWVKDKKFVGGTVDYTSSLVDQYNVFQQWMKDNNASNVKVKSAKSKFWQTQATGQLDLSYNVAWLFKSNVQIKSAVAKAEAVDDYGNWSYSNTVVYSIGGVEETVNFDGYQSQQTFTDFQLESMYQIDIEFDYSVNSDINYTDNQFKSNVKLPDIGFKFSASEVKSVLTYAKSNYTKEIDNYINSVKGTNIKSDSIVKISKAIANTDGSYSMGESYKDSDIISDQLFYVSFTSSDAEGTFNMLVSY